MEIVLTRELEAGDILAKDLLDLYGSPLLKKGTILTNKYIDKIKSAGIIYIQVQRDNYDNYDNKMNVIKDSMAEAIPEFFDNILNDNYDKFQEHIVMINEMVDYIVKTGEVKTSLFELREYDNYTFIHSVNTGIMATFIGFHMKLSNEELRNLAIGAILHDLGKMKLPLSILNKKGKLTAEEFDEVKKHSINGYSLLKNSRITNNIISDIVVQHHERIDGTGYPYNLKGHKISDYAKIVSVCDVFTALSANRCYRERFNPNDAYEFIISNNDIMFDSKIIKIFKENFAIYPKGCKVKISNGMEGIVVEQNKGFPDRPILKVYYGGNKSRELKVHDINLLECTNLVITDAIAN